MNQKQPGLQNIPGNGKYSTHSTQIILSKDLRQNSLNASIIG